MTEAFDRQHVREVIAGKLISPRQIAMTVGFPVKDLWLTPLDQVMRPEATSQNVVGDRVWPDPVIAQLKDVDQIKRFHFSMLGHVVDMTGALPGKDQA